MRGECGYLGKRKAEVEAQNLGRLGGRAERGDWGGGGGACLGAVKRGFCCVFTDT
jgi:hypothetical protein